MRWYQTLKEVACQAAVAAAMVVLLGIVGLLLIGECALLDKWTGVPMPGLLVVLTSGPIGILLAAFGPPALAEKDQGRLQFQLASGALRDNS